MFQVIDQVQKSIQDVTGVNDAMNGTQGGSDVLVGVVEAQIQRGSLVQEPFYWGLTSILRQAYEHMATVGKAIYVDNPRKLTSIVGEKGLMNIQLSKNHMLQDFRIFIKRSETKEQGIQQGNQLLFTLLQGGLIDQTNFANLFGRANPENIAAALRAYTKTKILAQNKADEIQGQQQQQMQAQQQQQMQGLAALDQQHQQEKGVNDEMAHQRDLEKIALKETMRNQSQRPQQPE
jgi:hypothetical protein